MISVEKPGSPSEILEHHGKKGMKWGVRNRASAKQAKRKSAVASKRQFHKEFPTSKSRTAEIGRARSSQSQRRTAFKSEKRGSSERKKLKDVFLNHPDRETARRKTQGERVVSALIKGLLIADIASRSRKS